MDSDLLTNSTMDFYENMDPNVPPNSPERKRKCDDTPTPEEYKNARSKTGTPRTPATPCSPGTPRTPATPCSPGTPCIPATPRTPGTPCTPATPKNLKPETSFKKSLDSYQVEAIKKFMEGFSLETATALLQGTGILM